ncbi:GGDEF domain-containing protein [Aureimonas endophytica]|uniref:diguanylate cyclase n=1 Tax=Aureimonas endophytica TaxID=2027858 RepID=A0A917E7P5_9HYPH|nr:GGDEF domain-containing protein [Aureimonas endophytica]GGE07347.1 GGDEF domain-containing protein [Aureimonas endophytica]
MRYPEPRSRVLRWIAEVGHDLPEDVRDRLRASFFLSPIPLIIGALNTIAVALTACLRDGLSSLFWIAVADTALLAFRIVLIRRTDGPSDLLFFTGLLWAALLAATIPIVMASGDLPMIVIQVGSAFCAIAGIIGRNFAAPRYALAQSLMIDLSFKISVIWQYKEFIPLVLLQSVIFVCLEVALLRQQRQTMIRAIHGENEHRSQSLTDPLTGLLNRRGLAEAFADRADAAAAPVLFYLDLDGFKQVNDRHGHAVGDQLLGQVAERLREITGPTATICRLGGDEFVLVTDLADRAAIRLLGARLVAELGIPYRLGESILARIGVSIGVGLAEAEGEALAAMMARADEALYVSKAQGKGRCILFDGAACPVPGRTAVA